MLTIEKMLKSGHNNKDRNEWNYQKVIKDNTSKVFIYDYPILEEFKNDFEEHFCAHFYKREFAFVPGEFCYYLSEKLNNIFPYYNEVLKRIGNYETLFGNGNEVFQREKSSEFSEDNTENSTVDNSSSTSVDTTRVTSNKNRDFPSSAVENVDSYLTDSQETHVDDLSEAKGTNKTTGSNIGKRNNNGLESEKYTRTNNNNINLYDYLQNYRKDIDDIYRDLYKKFDDLFLMVM